MKYSIKFLKQVLSVKVVGGDVMLLIKGILMVVRIKLGVG